MQRRNIDLARPRGYNKVSDEERKALINLLQSDENLSIKVAASQLGLKYENAKAIFRVYRKENRFK